jgi:hypothetical protein
VVSRARDLWWVVGSVEVDWMLSPIQIFGRGRRCVFGVEYLSCTLPLDFIRRTPSLYHGHEAPWWRERLFFDG